MDFARRDSPRYSQRSEPTSVTLLCCPACGPLCEHRLLYSANGCRIRRCQICGLGRAEAPEFDPGRYYASGYFAGRQIDGYADYVGAEPVLRHEFARTITHIRRRHGEGRLLEVGCAYGFFLQEAKPYFDVFGIELVADAVLHCRASGLHVFHGVVDAEKLRWIGNVDVVVLLDVIEHLSEPYETLAILTRHLNPGGIIVVTTGDFGSLVARLFGKRWRLMTPPQHLWFFTRESMLKMAISLGLSLEQIVHPWKIVPMSLIFFQLRRMIGVPLAPESRTRRWSGESVVGIPVNLFDAMRIILRKPA